MRTGGAAEKYAEDRQLAADGSQVCDYQGEYVGTLHNMYGQQLLEYLTLAMDTLGFDGTSSPTPHCSRYASHAFAVSLIPRAPPHRDLLG